jgi:hypothetical protein
LSSLTNLSVSHFEIPSPSSSPSQSQDGDPRSVSIKFEFSSNEYFEDSVLEKKFWYRRSKDGWSGLVSEPVKIQWKKDRDLTGGLLDMVCAAYDKEKTSPLSKSQGLSAEQKALKKKIDNTGMGGLSFFAWFGFIGRHISAEESREANLIEKERRLARLEKRDVPEEIDEEEDDEEEDDVGMSLEIFPDGDDLAVAITEDLWPGAIKYFSKSCSRALHDNQLTTFIAQAQEQDALSDADFESEDGELENVAISEDGGDTEADDSGSEHDGRPAKKQRSS